MQEQSLYEYAIVRVVPRVEREEFLNIGVILYCKDQKFLKLRYIIEPLRLLALCPKLDLPEIQQHMEALDKICAGLKDSGPIGNLDLPSRFRWLTATRSTIVQTSKVHPGFCVNAETTLDKLLHTMVCLKD